MIGLFVGFLGFLQLLLLHRLFTIPFALPSAQVTLKPHRLDGNVGIRTRDIGIRLLRLAVIPDNTPRRL
jgi:hypothetical protein